MRLHVTAKRKFGKSIRLLSQKLSVAKLLMSRGYRPLRQLKSGKVYLVRKDDQICVCKTIPERGLIAYRDVLPALRSRDIIAPKFVESFTDDAAKCWVVLEYIEGTSLENLWTEDSTKPASFGGQNVPQKLIPSILNVLNEFVMVDWIAINSSEKIRLPENYYNELIETCRLNFGTTHLSPKDISKVDLAIEVLSECDGVEIVSNSDFQIRNFVQLQSNNLAVIDWDHARMTSYELEHCITYQWLLMWGNPVWRCAFVEQACQRFSLRPDIFRAALVRNALMRAVTWRKNPMLVDINLNILKLALANDQILDMVRKRSIGDR